MNKFDEAKQRLRERTEEREERERAAHEMPGWKRAIIADLVEISAGLEATSQRVLNSADELKRREFMAELQRFKFMVQELKKKIL